MKIIKAIIIIYLSILSTFTHSEEPIEVNIKGKKPKVIWSENCISCINKIKHNIKYNKTRKEE